MDSEDMVLELLGTWALEQKLKNSDGVITKRKAAQDPGKLYAAFMGRMAQELPEAVPMSMADFKECLLLELDKPAEQKVGNFNIPTVESVADFVPLVLAREGLKISALGDEVTNKFGKSVAGPELENTLVCQAHLYNEESYQFGEQLRKSLPINAIKDFIRKEIADRASIYWESCRDILIHQEAFIPHTDIFLKAIVENFKFVGDPELNLAVLKQWIWQTKRFFMGLAVTDPLMINLYAARGGGGKTQIIKKLAQPLEEYTATATLDAILDTREHGLFTDRYVVFFDEMSLGKIENGQVAPLLAGLKKLLTEDKITQRNMGTNQHSKKKRTFSPAATSNQPMAQILPDDSGMRRFYEIEMEAEPNTQRIMQLRAIDATQIWQGIDENLERGYIVEGSALHTKFVERQQKLKHRSILDDCLDNMEDLPIMRESTEGAILLKLETEGATTKQIETRAEELGLKAYKVFEYRKMVKEWCEDNIDKQLTKWLPGNNRLPEDLVRREYLLIAKDKQNIRVIVKEAELGGGYV